MIANGISRKELNKFKEIYIATEAAYDYQPLQVKFLQLEDKLDKDSKGYYGLYSFDDFKGQHVFYAKKPFQLLKHTDHIHNWFITVSKFLHKKGKGFKSMPNLEDINFIFTDFDCSKNGLNTFAFIKHREELLKLAQLPEPVIKPSGHGYHFLWPIHQIEVHKNSKHSQELVKYWQNTENFVLKKLRCACKKIYGQDVVDHSVHDATRVLRVVGTYNCKKEHKILVKFTQVPNQIHSLKEFWHGKEKYRTTNKPDQTIHFISAHLNFKNKISPADFLAHEKELLTKAQLPKPLVQSSNTGCDFLWPIQTIGIYSHNKNSLKVAKYWRNTRQFTFRKLRKAEKKVLGFSRVNTKILSSDQTLASLYKSRAKTYSLSNFWYGTSKYTSKGKKAYRGQKSASHGKIRFYMELPKKKQNQGKSNKKFPSNYYTGFHRANWLYNALKYQKHFYLPRTRDFYLFFLGIELLKIESTQDVIKDLKKINKQIKPKPLEPVGMQRLLGEVRGVFTKANLRHYEYTSKHICKVLGISMMTNKQAKRLKAKQRRNKNKRSINEKLFNQISELEQKNLPKTTIARKLHTTRQQIYRIEKRHSSYSQHRCNSFCPHSIQVEAAPSSQSSHQGSSKAKSKDVTKVSGNNDSSQELLIRKRLLVKLDRLVSLGSVSKVDAEEFLCRLGLSSGLGIKRGRGARSSSKWNSKYKRNRKVRRLFGKGLSKSAISRRLKVSRPTVTRILRFAKN